ncbi:MAG: YncE family protein, partial [Candidatus Dormibacteraeota bacterium]|nr:YncE family protein [Candidatus Dormibacteraeota bacterium]
GQAWVLFPTSAGHVNFLNAQGTFGRPLGIGNQAGVIIASDSTTAWAVNTLSDSVQHVDMYGETVGAPIHVSRAPNQAVLTPDHHTLLVLSFGDGTQPGFLTGVDTRTSKASAPLAVGVAPSDLTLSPDGAIAYIANHQSNAITVVDLGLWRVRGALPLPCSPSQLVITPDGTELFANCNASAVVIPVKTHDLSEGAPIAVAASPTLVMSSQGKAVIVIANHVLQEIDPGTGTVVLSHDESGNIIALLPTPDDNTLVALENTGGAVLLIHTATLVTTSSIAVGSRPDELRVTPNGSRAYVLDTDKQKLYTVDVTAGKLVSTTDVSPNAASVIVPHS